MTSATIGQVSFQNRLQRIELRHNRHAAGGRAHARMGRQMPAQRAYKRAGSANVNVIAPRAQHFTAPLRLSWLERFKYWAIGFLLGGLLTLAKVAVLDPTSPLGPQSPFADSMMNALLAGYGFGLLIVVMGLAGFRQRPGLAQVSVALVAAIIAGLLS
jgi:hypothetical protein